MGLKQTQLTPHQSLQLCGGHTVQAAVQQRQLTGKAAADLLQQHTAQGLAAGRRVPALQQQVLQLVVAVVTAHAAQHHL
jgi:hypothetical protein